MVIEQTEQKIVTEEIDDSIIVTLINRYRRDRHTHEHDEISVVWFTVGRGNMLCTICMYTSYGCQWEW